MPTPNPFKISQPESSEYPESYSAYINLVGQNDLILALSETMKTTMDFLQAIPVEKQLFRYQAEKWTINEVILHVIDAERIFAYRALRYARNDKTVLSSFDENAFVENSGANHRTWADLLSEYESVRTSTIHLFTSFSPDMLLKMGQTDRNKMTVKALGFAILGHELHHLKVIRERYL